MRTKTISSKPPIEPQHYLEAGPYRVYQDPPYQWVIKRRSGKKIIKYKPVCYASNLEFCCYHLINLLMMEEPAGTHEDALKSFQRIRDELERLRLDAVETIRRESRIKP